MVRMITVRSEYSHNRAVLGDERQGCALGDCELLEGPRYASKRPELIVRRLASAAERYSVWIPPGPCENRGSVTCFVEVAWPILPMKFARMLKC